MLYPICLRMPKLAVFAGFIFKQFRMAAESNDISVIKNYDFITETAGSKPMTDEYSCFIICDFIKMFISLVFRNRIKSRCRLVKNDKRRIFIKRPRKRYFFLRLRPPRLLYRNLYTNRSPGASA